MSSCCTLSCVFLYFKRRVNSFLLLQTYLKRLTTRILNMPETVDITGLWQARSKKNDKRGDIEDILQTSSSDDNNSTNTPIFSDSTYNLEDHITPPVITPMEFSVTETSDSTEGSESDASKNIIPPYLFFMPSNTRALNKEFNRCLLLDLETMPSTSSDAIKRDKLRDAINAIQPATPSSSSDSSRSECRKINKKVTFSLQENVEETTKQPISTECDAKPECSSRALIKEFNRCLLLDVEPIPSTSAGFNMPSTSADVNMPSTSDSRRKTLRHPVCTMRPASSSSSSESINSGCNRVKFSLQENIKEEEESVSTDCDAQTEYSSKTRPSSSIESSQSDGIIPENSINIEFQENVNPEVFDVGGDDSRATDADLLDISDTYATFSATSLVDEEITNDLVDDAIAEVERSDLNTESNNVDVDAEINNELVEDKDLDSEPNDDGNKSYNNTTDSATYKNEASQGSSLYLHD